ncbi:hypothetical protein [Nonomuraea sp. NPDC003804]|uniref:hypothetical protein n=1 Tax=Nonomuraea sp. NPDC003804 TaxID=3154547 RepID=UPI0033B897E8
MTELPTGEGTWAAAAVGTDLYVGTYTPGDIHKVDTRTGTATKVADVKPDPFIWCLDAAPDGKIYAGTYPRGRVVEYDPATGQTRDFGQVVPGEQYVRSIAVDETTIYAGVGAKAHLSPSTGPPAPSARSCRPNWPTAYVASEIAGGLGTTPVEKEAQPAAFDLRTKRVRWSLVPVQGATSISDLVARRGKLYGVADTGVLFEFDPWRRKVTRIVQVPLSAARSGTLVETHGRLYGTDGRTIYRLDPSAMTISTVVDGLDAQAYGTQPLLAAAPDGRALYALRARNLVRVTL